jgi:inner membrane transporter RhtA
MSVDGGPWMPDNLSNVTLTAGATAGATTLRLFFASFLLIIFWRPWRFKFSISEIKDLFYYGISLGLMNLCFYFALEKIPLGLAVTLEFVGPLGLSLISSRKKRDFFWVLLAAAGLYLIMPTTQTQIQIDGVGILFALSAGLFWALYIYFGQKAGKNLPSGIATCIGMSFAALVVIPFGLFINGNSLFTLELLPLGLGVAILSSALPYSLEMVALKKIPTQTFGILMSLEPAIATLVGMIFLSEELSLSQVVAMGCVMLASLGSTLTQTNESA